MPQALDPAAYIFEGVWVNHAHSTVRGWTLTLSPERAILFTNALALFFSLAGGQLWSIVRFLLHQWKALPRTKEHRIIHHKEQIILRNTTNDITTTQLMWNHAWTSRCNGKTYSRAIFLGFIALLHSILFMIGAAFSNQIVSAGSIVLSKSPYCGVWNTTYYQITYERGLNPSSQENMTLSWQEYTKRQLDVEASLQYAKDCYLNQSSNGENLGSGSEGGLVSTACKTLAQPRLEWSTSEQSACPFGSLCHKESPVIVLDTGDLDSHQDLGINAPSKDRLTYRRVTTCAPLNDTGHIIGWDGYVESPSSRPEQHIAYAYYGPNQIFSTNYTYSYSNYAAYYTDYSAAATSPYQVYSAIAYTPGGPSLGDFAAIPELEQDAADLVLVFLSYTGNYIAPVDDPWFSSHQLHQINSTAYPYIDTQYARDLPVSTLACTEQHRFCNPKNGTCTPLAGYDAVFNSEDFNATLTPHQEVTFNRILSATTFSNMAQILYFLGDQSLLASGSSQSSKTSLSLGLPTNQWQLELEYWHSVAMAHLQSSIADWATGQVAADTTYLLPAKTEQDVWFCGSFTIRSTTYQSFILLAIILVFVFGMVIILLSFNIESIARWTRKRWTNSARLQYWAQDNMLNLPLLMSEDIANPNTPPKDAQYCSASSKQRIIVDNQFSEKEPVVSDITSAATSDCRRSEDPGPPPQYCPSPNFF